MEKAIEEANALEAAQDLEDEEDEDLNGTDEGEYLDEVQTEDRETDQRDDTPEEKK
jgi:hypothetical protein